MTSIFDLVTDFYERLKRLKVTKHEKLLLYYVIQELTYIICYFCSSNSISALARRWVIQNTDSIPLNNKCDIVGLCSKDNNNCYKDTSLVGS